MYIDLNLNPDPDPHRYVSSLQIGLLHMAMQMHACLQSNHLVLSLYFMMHAVSMKNFKSTILGLKLTCLHTQCWILIRGACVLCHIRAIVGGEEGGQSLPQDLN